MTQTPAFVRPRGAEMPADSKNIIPLSAEMRHEDAGGGANALPSAIPEWRPRENTDALYPEGVLLGAIVAVLLLLIIIILGAFSVYGIVVWLQS